MPDNNSILEKLNGLESRYEEVSTLITDPDVIADQQRYVKLTKEYKDLGDIMNARKRYINCLNSIQEFVYVEFVLRLLSVISLS